MSIYLSVRLTKETAEIARQAFIAREMVEIRDRHGVIHRGWVRSNPTWEFGVNAGFWIAFEMLDDDSTGPVLSRLLEQQSTET
jgi:hypothetical protein